MKKAEAWKPSMVVVVLDVIGAMLLGLGIAEQFAGINLVPHSLQFENYDVIMMVVGAFLMVPILFSVVAHAKKKSAE